MDKNVTRVKFFIFSVLFFIAAGGEFYYLNSRPSNVGILKSFVHVTNFFNIAFYSNTPYFRHRDLNNIDILFSYHPSLRESKVGTFINSAPVKK